jgi:hypothetical protein
MNRRVFVILPAVLCAIAIALVAAAGASAKVYSGEVTNLPEHPKRAAEEDLTAVSATFDSTTGKLSMSATTRAAPTENEKVILIGRAITLEAPCTQQAIQEKLESDPTAGYPALTMQAPYKEHPGAPTVWTYGASQKNEEEEEKAGHFGIGTRSVEGNKTTITATAPQAVGGAFTCAFAEIGNTSGNGVEELNIAIFPLVAQPEPTAPVVVPVPPAPTPPAPKPELSLLKSNPLKLKTEKWTTVKFKVSNPGTAAVGPITIKATAPKGVTVQTKSVKLPALLPGQTWPVSFRVKVTDAAKARSLLKLAASATGLSATGSVTIKATG